MNWLSIRTVYRGMAFRGLCGVVGLALLALSSDAQEQQADKIPTIAVSASYEEALEQYGTESVDAVEVTGPNNQKEVILIDYGPLGLTLKYQDLASEITVPEQGLRAVIQYAPEIDNALYAGLIAEDRRDEALELVRQEAYPLLKFVPMDPRKVQIHRQVDRLIALLIEEGEIAEAASILESFDRDRLTGVFANRAVEVGALLVGEGAMERAYELVKRFPLGPGQTAFADLYLRLANDLRENEQWEDARALYKDVQLASSATAAPEAFLWEAYIHLQEGRGFMVDGIVDQVGELDPKNQYFPLLQLIDGVALMNENRPQEALSAFAKGIVYSTTNDPWTPELLYRAAELYESQGLSMAASEIRNELTFFYPDSVWTNRI